MRVLCLCLAWLAADVSALGLQSRSASPLSLKARKDSGSSRQSRVFGWKSIHGVVEQPQIFTDGQGYRQQLSNVLDVQYYLYMSVGNQTLAGIMDTGSFDLVVFGKDCTTCGSSSKYDGAASPTHRVGTRTASRSYDSGVIQGREAWDRLSIGPYKNVNQMFWEVSEANMPLLARSHFDAIIGIGPAETAWEHLSHDIANASSTMLALGSIDDEMIGQAATEHTPLLRNLGAQMFSVCLSKEPDADGTFVWNDTSVQKHPELFHRVPVFGNESWTVRGENARLAKLAKPAHDARGLAEGVGHEHQAFDPFSEVSVGCAEGCQFLLDSGCSLLAMPRDVVAQLARAIQGAAGSSCSSMMSELPYIVFDIGGKTMSLPPDAYLARPDDEVPEHMQSFIQIRNLGNFSQERGHPSKCSIMVLETEPRSDRNPTPTWVMGMPWFRKYYTTFDVGSVASERAVYLAGASSSCTPTHRMVEVHDGPPEMWQRSISKDKLWAMRADRL